MNSGLRLRVRRSVTIAFVIVALMSCAGCGGGSAASSGSDVAASEEPSIPATMPTLAGRELRDVASMPWTRAGIDITVRFPAVEATWSIEATRHAGVFHPAHLVRQTFPAVDKSLSAVDDAKHTIVGQSPAPGSVLTTATRVLLTAGPHPNGTGEPWVTGHPQVVARESPTGCFDCHGPTDCAICHANLKR